MRAFHRWCHQYTGIPGTEPSETEQSKTSTSVKSQIRVTGFELLWLNRNGILLASSMSAFAIVLFLYIQAITRLKEASHYAQRQSFVPSCELDSNTACTILCYRKHSLISLRSVPLRAYEFVRTDLADHPSPENDKLWDDIMPGLAYH